MQISREVLMTVLKNEKGKPYRQGEKGKEEDILLKDAIVTILNVQLKDEKMHKYSEMITMGNLSIELQKDDIQEINIPSEIVVIMKDRIPKMYTPVLIARIEELIKLSEG